MLESKIEEAMLKEISYRKTRSKINWDRFGYMIFEFFQQEVKYRRRINKIDAIFCPSKGWISNSLEIQKRFLEYFQQLFLSTDSNKSFKQPTGTYCLSLMDQNELCKPFMEDVIKNVIWHMDPNKTPGPDGLSSTFYKNHWNIVGNSIMEVINDFFVYGHLLKEINLTYITLIPKVDKPTQEKHFRPISLCNVLYKIISTLMVNHMRPILGNMISPFQNAFVPGRHILDNILIAHEIIHAMRKSKKF